jgi:N-acetylmuramoyl-L-alanine amidase
MFRGMMEKDIALVVSFLLRDILLAASFEVVMTRDDDRYVPISKRTDIANEAKADVFVCLHMNADADPDEPDMREACVQEIWIYPGSRGGRLLAEAIHEQFQAVFPDEPWRGVKEEEFGVLVMTSMPAVLIEMGFIDCSTTARSMLQGKTRRDMAEAIARGIAEYAGKGARKI